MGLLWGLILIRKMRFNPYSRKKLWGLFPMASLVSSGKLWEPLGVCSSGLVSYKTQGTELRAALVKLWGNAGPPVAGFWFPMGAVYGLNAWAAAGPLSGFLRALGYGSTLGNSREALGPTKGIKTDWPKCVPSGLSRASSGLSRLPLGSCWLSWASSGLPRGIRWASLGWPGILWVIRWASLGLPLGIRS